MLTGISIGVTGFPPLPYDDRWRNTELVHDTFPHLDTSPSSYQTATAIRVSAILAAMDSIRTAYTPEHDLELARLFVLYLMGNFFFSNTSSSLQVAYMEAVVGVDFDCTIMYDWGTPILAYLYNCLDAH